MRRILSLSLAHPAMVLVFTAAFALAGAVAFWHLPIEAFPELADPQVQVISLFPGHAAEEVERQVTLPVEHEMNGLPGLTHALVLHLRPLVRGAHLRRWHRPLLRAPAGERAPRPG